MRGFNQVIGTALTLGAGVTVLVLAHMARTVTAINLLATVQMLAAYSLVWFLGSRPGREEHEVFERGREIGYDRGYQEGRGAARPVVVEMPTSARGG